MSYRKSSGGLFVSLDGVDASGKSSAVPAVKAFFEAMGRTVVVTREVGGTPYAEACRSLFLADFDERSTMAELLLAASARADHVKNIIVPALEAGHVVVTDRYIDSSLAYQCAAQGIPIGLGTDINNMATGGLWPDLTLIFLASPEVSKARLKASTGETDKFERAGMEFYARVHDCFAGELPFPKRLRRVNGNLNRLEVNNQINRFLMNYVDSLVDSTGGP